MPDNRPRLLVAGLRGGSGKTTLTIGLAAALRRRAWGVAPFKKGPDYIDSAWLTLASGRPCRNLDTLLMGEEAVLRSFAANTSASDIALIEGNRGLFDGHDASGTHSSAALARLLKAPVVLVADCSKTTRTIAALIAGCARFEPDLPLAGVVLNQVANSRHEKILIESVETHTDLPVLGALPRDSSLPLSMRHLGLVPPQEQDGAREAIGRYAELVEQYADVEKIVELAKEAEALEFDGAPLFETTVPRGEKPRVGVVLDTAFHFYYPENIEALSANGAEIVEVSAISDPRLPPLDGLYIGGGFPETQAKALAANEGFRASLKQAIEDGLPVYAECGGAMYLGQ
ncbi:MAG: cobyrinate a,c-diamide synthase, partial [bacterium]